MRKKKEEKQEKKAEPKRFVPATPTDKELAEFAKVWSDIDALSIYINSIKTRKR